MTVNDCGTGTRNKSKVDRPNVLTQKLIKLNSKIKGASYAIQVVTKKVDSRAGGSGSISLIGLARSLTGYSPVKRSDGDKVIYRSICPIIRACMYLVPVAFLPRV